MKRFLPSLVLAVAIAGPATAHIVLREPAAAPGAYYVAAFRVGHGCADQATTALRVELPAGVTGPKIQPKAGWTIERTEGAITWRGRLGVDEFDEFAVQVKLPATAGPLYFPTVQTCGAVEQRWVDIPAAGAAWTSVPHPAPVVTIGSPAAAAAGHQH